MDSQITRRDFLKLISLLPLVTATKWSSYLQKVGHSVQSIDSPNILVLVFDALSAYNASLYGYARETTPNLARFAERSTVYHNHYAGGNFTSSGTASLLTGTYPWTHRAINLHGTVADDFADRNLFALFGKKGYTRIAYSHNYLATSLLYQFRAGLDVFKWTRELCLVDDQYADRLLPNDFNVAFWSEWLTLRGGETQPGSLFLSLIHRFIRSFHKRNLSKEYGRLFPRGVPNLHNMYFVLEDAIDWAQDQLLTLPQPFLFYLHVLPPHEPYTTRQDFVDIFKDGWKPKEKPARFFSEGHSQEFLNKNRREYDEYLAYADAEFGRLYDFMVENGVLNNTLVIFTSDHGEMLERGIRGHVTETLYQPITRVPLLISRPGEAQRQDVYTPTSCVDVIPTLMHLTGQNIPVWCEGQVLPPFDGQIGDRNVFSVEGKSNPKHAPLKKATISLVNGDYKLIHYAGYGNNVPKYELFDIANDPEEQTDLISSRKATSSALKDILQDNLRQANQPYL
jgi:arylsulfatase A-like enzyme